MDNYPWYTLADGGEQLLQGDFLYSCPILVPPVLIAPGEIRDFDAIEYDVVIMSQSCDLEHEKLELVLVCPFFSLSVFEKKSEYFKSSNWKESVRQGNEPGYHMLKESTIEGFKTELLIVDFRSVFSVPYYSLVDLAEIRGKRLRLLPPYREHLSQAFARFFMRVGLPVDIPAFKRKK